MGRFQREEEPRIDLGDALEHVLDAAKEFVTHKIELTKLELKTSVGKTVGKMALIGGGVFAAVLGWLALMAGTVIALLPFVPAAVSLLVLGAIHLAVGIVLVIKATRSEPTPHVNYLQRAEDPPPLSPMELAATHGEETR